MRTLLKEKNAKTFILFVFFSTFTLESYACECLKTKSNSSIENYFNQAKLVFEGKPLETSFDTEKKLRQTKIKTSRWWKGADKKYVTVHRLPGKQCDLFLKKEQTYLIFALWDKKNEVFRVSTCGYSKKSYDAQLEFNLLKKITSKKK